VASDTSPGDIRYRFKVKPPGGSWGGVRDYSPLNTLTWTPSQTDGLYNIQVSVLNRSTLQVKQMGLSYTVTPIATGSTPVVSPTSHPLIALYSAPVCPVGSTIKVKFELPGSTTNPTSTRPANCYGTSTNNFYLVGMRASTTYNIRQYVTTGSQTVPGPLRTFTTGALGVTLPAVTAIDPLQPPSDQMDPVLLFAGLEENGYPLFAVDSSLSPIWYSATQQIYLTRPVAGGYYMVSYGFTTDLTNSGLREYDMVGNLIKETNVERMNDQLAALGMNPVTAFHHEIRVLPNGDYLLLGQTELASDAQGPPDDIAGDMILVLDANLQLVWSWDTFTHLDVNRPATLGETCTNETGICVLLLGTEAHDWTHGNCVQLTPDGNLLYSSRNQDFAYKINYQNGAGDGSIIWMLGMGGNFTYLSGDPYPWFSHQHDVEYANSNTITVFDDGNTRVTQFGGDSRGQSLQIDETAFTVTFLQNVDLGSYSSALGSAQLLSGGNYVYDNGLLSGPSTQFSEWSPSSTEVSNVQVDTWNYRTFRLPDLYATVY
jgi:hypothetical protein